ncbi:hypothetical protein M422DRAFT_153109 [Sphaerobolus stellatus SS14]|nr:hypothetical protein M422DRAFT_153109 [Sphaerobolus stellatus SS14]
MIPIVCRNSRHLLNFGERPARTFAFPILWTAVWLLVSRVSPVGRLITWTPLVGIDSYRWLRSVLGFSGIDWIVAMWANVAAETLEGFLSDYNTEEILIEDLTEPPKEQRNTPRLSPSIAMLLILSLPSFFIRPSNLPLPVLSSDTTPLSVACILPPPSTSGSQLERFMDETKHYTSMAKILLWPEGAVTFESEKEKNEAFDLVLNITSTSKTWVGVSFEERLPPNGDRRDGLRRNGLALIGRDGVQLTYYKRKLVPIAESFSQITLNEDPSVEVIQYPRPNDIPKKEWDGHDTRPISITASICLDFAAPLTSLESRPSLILAPAKTWHVGVGRAMYEMARARGEEVGAEVLWCDGGAGGLSGVAGDVQVGGGSWVKRIGVAYPPEEKKTVYAFGGDILVMGVLFAASGGLWVIHDRKLEIMSLFSPYVPSVRATMRNLFENIRNRLPGRRPAENVAATNEHTPLLIDA